MEGATASGALGGDSCLRHLCAYVHAAPEPSGSEFSDGDFWLPHL